MKCYTGISASEIIATLKNKEYEFMGVISQWFLKKAFQKLLGHKDGISKN